MIGPLYADDLQLELPVNLLKGVNYKTHFIH